MCLYSKLIPNKKYAITKKNEGNVPIPSDPRVLWVAVGCGKCMECKKQKGRAWSARLQEEIKTNHTGQFVTLTFSDEWIAELGKEKGIKETEGYARDNAIAKIAVRRFLERWRKKHGKSIKHWLVTELGHEGTENIHMHGILFTDKKEDISTIWKYGFVYVGDYVNEATVNYCVKYSTKTDDKHKNYNQKILTSAGIGSNYTKTYNAKQNKYKEGGTDEAYTTRQGKKMNMPTYYRNKIYTEEEREKLWLEKLDKQERWVDGTNISIKNGMEHYMRALEAAQAKNKRLGYGDNKEDWTQKNYENQLRNIRFEERTKKTEKGLTRHNEDITFEAWLHKLRAETSKGRRPQENKREDSRE